MSRYSLNSSLALFQSVLSDPDATNSSTSSSSALHNSPNSLSVSPAIDREPIRINPKQPNQKSNHLLELQREIKEEEDEIFADIDSLINNRSDLYSTLDDTDDFEDNRGLVNLTCRIISNNNSNNNNNNNSSAQYLDLSEDDHGYGFEDQILVQNETSISQDRHVDQEQPLEVDENQYVTEEQDFVSCNRVGLQQEEIHLHQIHSHEEQQQLHAIQQQKDIQQVTSNLPKPCVFFLEGNCRRSDCKYSHDLSSITCKYWIEGFCFKGELCPFLHSFATNNMQDSELLDESGLPLSKRDLAPTFTIESEADFPSLSLDSPGVTLIDSGQTSIDTGALTKSIKNQILSSNSAVVFKSTKKKRKKG